MNRCTRILLAVSFLLALGAKARAQASTPEVANRDARIIVLIYNYARIPQQPLARAIRLASETLQKAGVGARWAECRTRLSMKQVHAACQRPLGAAGFSLKLLPRDMAVRFVFPAGTVGFALPSEGMPGGEALVFYDQLKDLAVRRGGDLAETLALAATHELGHLLLGVRSHSPAGIMRAAWVESHLLGPTRASLNFTPAECDQIRVRLRASVRRDPAGQLAALDAQGTPQSLPRQAQAQP